VIYNCADLLSSIGVRETVLAAERRVLAEADLIRLTSSRMRDMIGAPARSVVSFHGVDKDLFDRCETSPYEHGSTNFISVGNMLFDQAAVAEIARVDSRIRIHVFGAKWEGARPENVTDYGERPFTAIVPYIKFADGGIAPYRLRPEHHYLVQSSLKVLQYTYCALPIIAPNSVDWGRKHVITYDPNDVSSFGRAVAAVRSFPRMTIDASGIRTWSQTLEDMLMSLDPARESLRYG
jgi:2-beta-glucuronyltransferase